MRAIAAAVLLLASGAAASGAAAQAAGRAVMLPGIRYEVLASGPATGAHPQRGDTVSMRYVGRLSTSEIFSTSAEGGAQPSDFKVREVIPGMSAALQLMRPGDRWRLTLPAYLAYGALGRHHVAADRNLERDIPPDATLVFEVELVSVTGGAR
ncbi:MAG: FKBP-type peptidyl-prolyl cis-trans isomerase [Phenylobacterium sp.]|nr:MAG: FKBP-type peptidyl-prolyl cis-trans isomerase [Phenylobacterium sp.]